MHIVITWVFAMSENVKNYAVELGMLFTIDSSYCLHKAPEYKHILGCVSPSLFCSQYVVLDCALCSVVRYNHTEHPTCM